jgi:hypothetical protein
MKRLVFLLGALVGAGAVAATLLVAGASGRSSGGVTFRVVEKNQAFHFIDNPPRGGPRQPPSQGDTFQIKSVLLTRSMRPAGTLVANCTVTNGGIKSISTCFGTFILKGGQLQLMVSAGFNGAVTRIAVVGGTGAYAGARGTVTSVSRGQNSPYSDDTVRLLP